MYCTEADLEDYLLAGYLNKIEELKAGSIVRHISNVSEEIDEAIMQGGWDIPEDGTSFMLKRICAVMVDWRLVAEITSLMDTEASSANEWLPLQKLNARAEKDLDKIRDGKLKPFPGVEEAGTIGIMEIDAPAQIFTREKWELF